MVAAQQHYRGGKAGNLTLQRGHQLVQHLLKRRAAQGQLQGPAAAAFQLRGAVGLGDVPDGDAQMAVAAQGGGGAARNHAQLQAPRRVRSRRVVHRTAGAPATSQQCPQPGALSVVDQAHRDVVQRASGQWAPLSVRQQAGGHPIGEDDPAVLDLSGQIDHQHGLGTVLHRVAEQFEFGHAVQVGRHFGAGTGDQAQLAAFVVHRVITAAPVLGRAAGQLHLIDPADRLVISNDALEVVGAPRGQNVVLAAQFAVLVVVQPQERLGGALGHLGVADRLGVHVQQLTPQPDGDGGDRKLVEHLPQLIAVQSAGGVFAGFQQKPEQAQPAFWQGNAGHVGGPGLFVAGVKVHQYRTVRARCRLARSHFWRSEDAPERRSRARPPTDRRRFAQQPFEFR